MPVEPRADQHEWARAMMALALRAERSYTLTDFLARGGKLHSKDQCKATRKAGGPKNCVIHKPSIHKLTGSPQVVRADTRIEDICPHGIGHTNPDSAAYLNWRDGSKYWGSHGCDGCCGDLPEGVLTIRPPKEANPGWPPQ